MSEAASELRDGMVVVGSDGRPYGEVTQVRRDDFLVHRELELDVYVLNFAVQEIDGNTVVLKAPGDRLLSLDWAVPAVHGLPRSGTAPAVEAVTDAAARSWPHRNLPPHRPWHDLLQPDQRVFSIDGVELGRVKQIEEQRFLLDRSLARDRWVPYRFLDHVDGESVTLSPTAAAFAALDLDEPPLP
ncbi:MAG TPA: DUF2171 domain-containing protein [Thermomicrobiaceae bacterium]|nr:DUF2171 domain-containing protein [Thermomicrobiaceae bacterium]